jgi:uncharacterized repeat protein (TIGR03806 family)
MTRPNWKFVVAGFAFLCLAPAASDAAEMPAAHLDAAGEPARWLSDYHFFLDTKRQIPNARVIPYELNTPHFADYAHLRRFLWVPEGAGIVYRDNGELEFPTGAVLILSIGYLHDLQDPALGENLLETRLLVNRKEGWRAAQYNWNADATDARLSVTGARTEVAWTHHDGSPRSHAFLAPNNNQCKQCHEHEGKVLPLGPTRADRINRDCNYSDGTENQLSRWSKIGLLVGAPQNPADVPRMAAWDDPASGSIDERARAYLEMNCSSCHRPNGIAYSSGLDLTSQQRLPIRYGVFKAPAAAGRGAGNWRFAIEPGQPDRSFLVHRMRSTDPGIRMPMVGRGLVHDEGVALIEEWIAGMQFAEMAEAQARAEGQSILRSAGAEEVILRDSRSNGTESQ